MEAKDNPLIQLISSFITDFRDTLIEVGFEPSQIAFKASRLEKCTDQELKDILDWLQYFRDGVVHNYKKAKVAVPESVWAFYKATGLKGTQEQNQLNLTRQLLKVEWRNRSPKLKRSSNGGSKGKNQKTGRSC